VDCARCLEPCSVTLCCMSMRRSSSSAMTRGSGCSARATCALVLTWHVELHSRHALCRLLLSVVSTCSCALWKASLMQSWMMQEVHRLGREHDQGGGHRVQVQARRRVPDPLHRAGCGLQQARAGDRISAQGQLPPEAEIASIMVNCERWFVTRGAARKKSLNCLSAPAILQRSRIE